MGYIIVDAKGLHKRLSSQRTSYTFALQEHVESPLRWFVYSLEEAIIRTCRHYHVCDASRDGGNTGVWVKGNKIASIGLQVSKWITYHGICINVDPICLPPFEDIVMCELEGRKPTCLMDEMMKEDVGVVEGRKPSLCLRRVCVEDV
eukprot:PhF_6_TR7036/c1_g1_i7/m.10556/K03801/lipB; lipoyl(octanoyl) transferase